MIRVKGPNKIHVDHTLQCFTVKELLNSDVSADSNCASPIMAKRSKPDPRTVLISSRIDELGSSRRAAFRAVHDEGWIPLLYELEPSEWIAADLRATRKEKHYLESNIKKFNEKLTMNRLLFKADHFVGIYGTSLGDPSPSLKGLRPLEYEILCFLGVHARKRSIDELDASMLPSGSCSTLDCLIERAALEEALKQIRGKSGVYHRVFRDRVALFLKEPPSDVPASSLMYSTLSRLRASFKKNIRFFKADVRRVAKDTVVYWRPSTHLYQEIRRQIRKWKRNRAFQPGLKLQGQTTSRLQFNTQKEVGSVLTVVTTIFFSGYNVEAVRLGRRRLRGGEEQRVMEVKVRRYLASDTQLHNRLRDTGCQLRKKNVDLSTWKDLGGRHQKWKLDLLVADRPGMLARSLAALALRDMQVLDILIKKTPGSRNALWVIFENPGKKRRRKTKPRASNFLYSADPKFALEFIATDLSSQPGFYFVSLDKVPRNISLLDLRSEFYKRAVGVRVEHV